MTVDPLRLMSLRVRGRLLDHILGVRRPLVVGVHLCLFAAAYGLAFGLRFDFALPHAELKRLAVTVLALVVLRAAAFAMFHLYEGLWRYVGMRDVTTIIKAVTLSSAIFTTADLIVGGHGFPRSVIVLDWVLCVVLTGGLRIATRLLFEHHIALSNEEGERRRAIVVGAGDVADALLREVARGRLPYDIVGLVADDPRARGRRLHGVSVLGGFEQLAAVCAKQDATDVLIALDEGSREEKRVIGTALRGSGIVVRMVPALTALLRGDAGIGQLRRVGDEELLGREPIGTNVEVLREELTGNRVLVTGGAGSIGSELARQIASFGPDVLVLYDRAESDLHIVTLELQERFPGTKIVPVIGDILDEKRVRDVMNDYAPQLVYHAAAYKHVAMMEAHPVEAIKNNVFGTEIVAKAAIDGGATEFVLISTDKAVRPVGIMGMTKRVAELVIRSLAGQGTTFVAVRFGNVLGSNGSVLPIFQRQIASGSAVTVTEPDALRYFMLTSEAVELVLQAGSLGRDGEVYVLHTGEPIRMGDLAENFIRLSGLEPGVEVPIKVTGLKPGERLREELVVDDEDVTTGPHEKILVVREPSFDAAGFSSALEMLRVVTGSAHPTLAVDHLRALVAPRPRATVALPAQYVAS